MARCSTTPSLASRTGALTTSRSSISHPRKLLGDGHIDTVIGVSANLFYSIGIPVCILVVKNREDHRDLAALLLPVREPRNALR